MRSCPYCAEDIQDAAIVCKHCGRELKQSAVAPAAMPAAPAPQKKKSGAGKVIGLAVVGVAVWFVYYVATSSASIDPVAAQRVVDGLEQDGVLTAFSCKPNVGTLSDAAWLQLTKEQRERLLGALSRVCITKNGADGGLDFTLYRASTHRPLATYDGRTMNYE